MVMPELVLIVKRKVVIRLKNPMNGTDGVMDDGVLEGSRFGACPKISLVRSRVWKARTSGSTGGSRKLSSVIFCPAVGSITPFIDKTQAMR
jgi:hypothetical protein